MVNNFIKILSLIVYNTAFINNVKKSMQIKELQKENYPKLLQQVSALPPKLNYKGEIPDDDYKFLCVVGARNYSEYGADVCKKLIGGLRSFPIVIVSGLAIGIDSIAHEVALDNDLKTISFPGSGLNDDVLYPQRHRKLAQRIIDSGGAVISQFPDYQIPTEWTFPSRNRLMAGISHATLIIEAKKGSGTLITADFATDFNREVLAVPGSIFNDLSYGPHMLINRGARPIFSSQDILEVLGFIKPEERNESVPQLSIDSLMLEADEKRVMEELNIQNLQASELAFRTELPPSVLNMTLSKLELKGLIKESVGVYRVSV